MMLKALSRQSPSTLANRSKLIFIVGSTASGKSDFAVRAAEAIRTAMQERSGTKSWGAAADVFLPEIINSDSVQFFKGVEIGAAKPEPELLARVPHHLVSVIEEGKAFTAGDFRRQALALIEDAGQRGVSTIFCVGGSGFYNQALEKGMYPVPEVPALIREQVERDLDQFGSVQLHAELMRIDPDTAIKIKPADRYRISRATEIIRASVTGETLSQMKRRFESETEAAPFDVYKFGLSRNRENLRRRVERRTAEMLSRGLLKEVEGLRARGLKDWAPLQSVGYREVQEYLEGRLDETELAPLIVTSTMQLAKRQTTWFRRDPKTMWFDAEAESAEALRRLCAAVLE